MDEINEALRGLTPENGYPICPSVCVSIDVAEEIKAKPKRSIGILECGTECELWLNADGMSESVIRETATKAIRESGLSVDAQSEGLPIIVSLANQPASKEGSSDATTEEN